MQTNWPTKKLGEVLDRNGVIPAKIKRGEYQESGKYPVVDQGENLIAGYIDDEQKLYRGDLPVIIFGDHTRIVKYIDFPFAFGADGIKILRPQEILLPKFFYYTLILNPVVNQGYKRHFSLLEHTKILIPPLKTQKQIVERLDKIAEAQKLNDNLIQKTDELFQSLLHKELNPVGKGWEVKKLSETGDIITGTTPSTQNADYWNGEFLWATPTDIKKDTFMLTDTPKKLSREGYEKTRPVPKNAILVTCIASIGKMAIAGKEMATNQQINSIVCNKNSDPLFIFFSLQKDKKKLISLGKTTAVPIINKSEFGRIKIFLPPLEIQKQIVAKLSAVQDYKKQLLEQKSKLKELFNSALAKSFRQ